MFIEAEESNIYIFFSTLKPGLISKSEEISLWTCRIFAKLSFELANLDLLAPAYEWFCREHGGLHASLLAL